MRFLFRLAVLGLLIAVGGLLYIRRVYGCSWQESLEIADQFLADLLGCRREC